MEAKGFGPIEVVEDSFTCSQVETSKEKQVRGKRKEPPLRCPRCESDNTKFCYYNNYSHAQPRHFCRTCRRYWTEGGALRNVPVGGGHKSKRGKLCDSDFGAQATSISVAPLATDAIFLSLCNKELLGPRQPPPASTFPCCRNKDDFPLQLLSPPLAPEAAVASSWNLPPATSPSSPASWSIGGQEALGRISSGSVWVEQSRTPLLPAGLWDVLEGADELTVGDLQLLIALEGRCR